MWILREVLAQRGPWAPLSSPEHYGTLSLGEQSPLFQRGSIPPGLAEVLGLPLALCHPR